jgi:hypothetical protein
MSAINAVFGTVGLAYGIMGALAPKPYGPPSDQPPSDEAMQVDDQTPPTLRQDAGDEAPMTTSEPPMDGQPPMEGPPKKGGLPFAQYINLTGLVSGFSTLFFYF